MGWHRIGAGFSSFHGRRRRPLYNARRIAAGTMAAGGDGRNARPPAAARLPERPAPRRPGAMTAPRPAGRTPPTQQRHPRAKQEAGARRGRPLREVHKISVLCAPWVHKTHILLTYQGGRAAERRNPTPGGSGVATPALRRWWHSIYGGVLRHPPMGALCFVPRENHQKKFVMVADMSGFFV